MLVPTFYLCQILAFAKDPEYVAKKALEFIEKVETTSYLESDKANKNLKDKKLI
jgi:hypothetical protein